MYIDIVTYDVYIQIMISLFLIACFPVAFNCYCLLLILPLFSISVSHFRRGYSSELLLKHFFTLDICSWKNRQAISNIFVQFQVHICDHRSEKVIGPIRTRTRKFSPNAAFKNSGSCGCLYHVFVYW